VSVEGINPAAKPATLLATMYFADEPNRQCARQLWLPPRSLRRSWCPIRPPERLRPDQSTVELRSRLFDRSGPADVLLSSAVETWEYSRLMSIDHGRVITGVIWDRLDGRRHDHAALHLIAAMRMSAGVPPIVSVLYEDFLPPVTESLEGLRQLVLAGDRLADDPAALAAVRRWLLSGGRLWVLLDQVDTATVEMLLGDSFACHVVDRVGLTQVQIVDTDQGAEQADPPVRDFDEPVDLVRVLVDGAEVTHTVNGWPASFWRKFGRGRVLFTTLGPHGWMRPRKPDDPKPVGPYDPPPFVATAALGSLMPRLFDVEDLPLLEPEQFESYLSEQIGYRIVGRGSIAAALGGFCLALFAAGIWLAAVKRLERILWIGAGLAAAATLVLIAMGVSAKKTVPPTVAVAQLVHVEPGADDVAITGLAAIYNQAKSDAPLGAGAGGTFHPDLTGLEGTARRLVRTDLDAWHWENLSLPPGVRTGPFQFATKVDHPIVARAAFGPDGLGGALDPGPFEDLADAVIATPWNAHLAVPLDDRGRFTVGSAEALAPGQFITGGLLRDEQRRRQSVYQQMLSDRRKTPDPDRLMLFAWARPLTMGFTFPDYARRVGSALLAVPLRLEPTEPGTQVMIPSPCLPYRSIHGPLQQISSAYSNATHEWFELRAASTACLRFQVPEVVLPLEVNRATFTVEINAPSRKVDLIAWDGQREVPLASRTSPMGTLRAEIDRADVLQPDDRGGLRLGIVVGENQAAPPGPGLAPPSGSAWRIHTVRLELTGRTSETETTAGEQNVPR
jgi:hypothetical protein